jgi:KaiC/GvpD/RAD55 family RecA-like ATPase
MEDIFLKSIQEHLDDLSKEEPVNIEEFEDVIEEIHAKLGHDRVLSRDIIKSFFNIMRLNIANGEKIILDDVGVFKPNVRGVMIWKSSMKLKSVLKDLASYAQESSHTER